MKRLALIVLPIVGVLLAWALLLKPGSAADLQERFRGWVSPLASLSSGGGAVSPDGRTRQQLTDANARLREENARLRIERDFIRQLRAENDQLRRDLDFVRRSRFSLVPARVIRENRLGWWLSVVIDKGRRDGITRDLAVITDRGVVGKTINVQEGTATVLLITDERCQLSARIEPGPAVGITRGKSISGRSAGVRGAARLDPAIALRYIDRKAAVTPGMRVVTAGLGKLYPEGYPVGTVSTYQVLDTYGEATVSPAADLDALSTVFVVQREAPAASREEGGDA